MTQDTSSRGGQGTSAGGSATAGTKRDMAEQARDKARQATDQAQHRAGEVAGQARHQVTSQLATQKERVADDLGSLAGSLRQTGQQLRDQEQNAFTSYIDRAASQIDDFSGYLRQKDMGQLVDDVESFARREPAMFIGGAFLLGLLGARFLKSSRPQPRYSGHREMGRGYEPQYQPYYTGYATGPGMAGTSSYMPETRSQPQSTAGQRSAEQIARERRGAGIYERRPEE